MNYNEQVLNRSLDNYLMKDYMEEYPASDPAPTAFEDAEQQISSYVSDYITENDSLPEVDDVADMFGIKSDVDYEALEKFMERERRYTDWKTPSLK